MTGLLPLLLLAATAAPVEKAPLARAAERTVIVGAGAALEVDPKVSAGVGAFIEYEAIEGVIELELGGQVVHGLDGNEPSADLLVKWPRRLTPTLEVMIGAGPTIVGGTEATPAAWGIGAAVDVMWWPTRRLGFWIEPSYELLFRADRRTAFGCTAGPMIGW